MKYSIVLPTLLAAFSFAVPTTGLSKDRHHHESHDHYCAPVYPSYSYSRPSAYYYTSPSFGVSFYSRPTYTSERTYYRSVPRSDDYGDDLAVDVQRALARRGYYSGGIDGDVGPGTRAAIRRYQYEHRLEVTGRIDRSLLRSLGLD